MLRSSPARIVTLALTAAALAVPAAASADSIVFTRAGNVFVAAPDGSQQRQLTRDGSPQAPYRSPTQADDGTILALHGTRLHKLDRNGALIGSPIATVMTDKPMNVNAVGPFDPKISPDGRKVAYWVGVYSSWTDHGQGIEWTNTGSSVVWQDLATGKPIGITGFYEEPSWLPDSSGALLFDDANALTAQVVAADVGANHNAIRQWFHDSDNKPADQEYWRPISAGELSKQMNKFAILRGGTNIGNGGMAEGAGNAIALYSVNGLGAPPAKWPCEIAGATGGQFASVSWAPSGAGLAWAEGDGVWTTPIGDGCGTMAPKLTIADAAEPDWGPADAGAPAPPKPGPQQNGARAATVKVPARISRRALQRRGLAVRVTCPVACAVTADARRGRKRVGAKRTTLAAAGTKRLMLKARRARAGRLTVRVLVSGNGLAQQRIERRVRVTR